MSARELRFWLIAILSVLLGISVNVGIVRADAATPDRPNPVTGAHATPTAPTQRLKVGTFNIQRDHAVKPHTDMVIKTFLDNNLDVLMIQEAGDYYTAIKRAAARQGIQCICYDNRVAAREQITLVKAGLPITRPRAIQAADRWYWRQWNHWSFNPYITVVAIRDTWFVNLHSPVGVDWPNGHPTGWDDLVRAYLQHTDTLVRFAKTHPHRALVFAGDHNARPFEYGPGTPRDLEHRIKGTLIDPKKSTGHGPIDFPIIRNGDKTNIAVSKVRVHGPSKPRSDHRLVTWYVTTTKPVSGR